MHGGSVGTGRPVSTGTGVRDPERMANRSITARAKEILADPKLLDIRPQLALLKSMLEAYIEKRDDADTIKQSDIEAATRLVESCAKVTERWARIQNADALTKQQLVYFQARMADIMKEYVPVEKHASFLKKLREAVTNATGGPSRPEPADVRPGREIEAGK